MLSREPGAGRPVVPRRGATCPPERVPPEVAAARRSVGPCALPRSSLASTPSEHVTMESRRAHCLLAVLLLPLAAPAPASPADRANVGLRKQIAAPEVLLRATVPPAGETTGTRRYVCNQFRFGGMFYWHKMVSRKRLKVRIALAGGNVKTG